MPQITPATRQPAARQSPTSFPLADVHKAAQTATAKKASLSLSKDGTRLILRGTSWRGRLAGWVRKILTPNSVRNANLKLLNAIADSIGQKHGPDSAAYLRRQTQSDIRKPTRLAHSIGKAAGTIASNAAAVKTTNDAAAQYFNEAIEKQSTRSAVLFFANRSDAGLAQNETQIREQFAGFVDHLARHPGLADGDVPVETDSPTDTDASNTDCRHPDGEFRPGFLNHVLATVIRDQLPPGDASPDRPVMPANEFKLRPQQLDWLQNTYNDWSAQSSSAPASNPPIQALTA